MEEKFTFALRRIALLGGLRDSVTVSSRELGEALEMSQQSASKRILELLEGKVPVSEKSAQIQFTEQICVIRDVPGIVPGRAKWTEESKGWNVLVRENAR